MLGNRAPVIFATAALEPRLRIEEAAQQQQHGGETYDSERPKQWI